jgi:hypothetical protein
MKARLPIANATEIDEQLCFGLVCDRHQHCARYVAIDGAPATSVDRIATCRDKSGSYRLFVNARSLSVEAEVLA